MRLPRKIHPRDWSIHPPYLYPPYRSTEFRAPSKRRDIAGRVVYHFDIRLQGDRETVSFEA